MGESSGAGLLAMVAARGQRCQYPKPISPACYAANGGSNSREALPPVAAKQVKFPFFPTFSPPPPLPRQSAFPKPVRSVQIRPRVLRGPDAADARTPGNPRPAATDMAHPPLLSAPAVRLELRHGTARPVVYDVAGDEFVIGAVPGCDLRLSG